MFFVKVTINKDTPKEESFLASTIGGNVRVFGSFGLAEIHIVREKAKDIHYEIMEVQAKSAGIIW